MIYLASPHSDPDEFVREARYMAAMKATARLLKEGKWTYSPIVHCHAMAIIYQLPAGPNSFQFWKEYDEHMLGLSTAMYILKIEGWDKSSGIANEIEFAMRQSIPVSYIDE